MTDEPRTPSALDDLQIDLPDPTPARRRALPGLEAPADPAGLKDLMARTPARIGVGRAGPRPRSAAWLLFQADQAVTQDALYREVDNDLLEELNFFKVESAIEGGKSQYLVRPDLGRRLSCAARQTVLQNCPPQPRIQICVGDGLSAQAVEANLPILWPALAQGCQQAGLTLGRPFFIHNCRVGVMNDIGDLLQPEVLLLLIGERPGLGRAESLSIYMGYRPQSGHTDADRDVICNVYKGGLEPLEAAAQALELAQKMMRLRASGVRLKLAENAD